MNKKHILIADDELNMLQSLEFILEVAGYKVTAVQDGREALEKIIALKDSSEAIQLLITDIQMPELSGIELIDTLKRLNIDLPVFVITAYGNKELREELKRKGCFEFLDKPFDDEQLVERVTLFFENEASEEKIVK